MVSLSPTFKTLVALIGFRGGDGSFGPSNPESIMSEHQAGHRHESPNKGCCGCGGGNPAAVAPGTTLVTDPVCGMTVDPATSKHRQDHDGVTYYFCCGGCRSKFAADPAKYVLQPAEALADVKTATDPVCGMKVDPTMSKHRLDHSGSMFHFCSAGCQAKFAAAPEAYLKPKVAAAKPAKPGAIYTCPMHPQIRQVGPGSCPICGMALEPVEVSAAGPFSSNYAVPRASS